jgi:hypothetical protein
MSSKKTISINPSLFRIGGAKTRKNNKNKNKENKPVKPLINPNILKKKLLKRIQEHKQSETKEFEKKNNDGKNENNGIPKSYPNEFSESIDYLQSLSKQKKKENLDNILKNKTVKKPNLSSSPYLEINVELSDELQPVQMNNEIRVDTSLTPVTLKSPVLNDNVPYGILKGGKKPTYRNWLKTSSNNTDHTTNQNRLQYLDREKRLHNLREKLKNKEKETNEFQKLETNELQTNELPTNDIQTNELQKLDNALFNNNIQEPILQPNEEIIGNKKTTKKITKKTYTLGKFKNKQKIGVLIKNRDTRKKIISAQRNLKKTPIQEIKNYLKQHNLIKIGGNAPNDVIHKLYESAILCGEITNTNSETLFHNFSKLEKQL